MALLHKKHEETREERRLRIFAEAEEFRRKHRGRPIEELMAEARQLRESIRENLPEGFEWPDSVDLLREDRER